MISIEWIHAPASTGGTVIGHTQELQVTDFLRDYKVHYVSYVSKKELSTWEAVQSRSAVKLAEAN